MSMKNIASRESSSFLSIVRDEQVQPNAVDIKIDKMFEIKHQIRQFQHLKPVVCREGFA